MNKTPTKTQIAAEIKALTKLKTTVPKKSLFGDNNHAGIDAQIMVISGKLTEADIWERSGDYMELCGVDDPDWTESTHQAAMDAVDWLKGDRDQAPSKDWK